MESSYPMAAGCSEPVVTVFSNEASPRYIGSQSPAAPQQGGMTLLGSHLPAEAAERAILAMLIGAPAAASLQEVFDFMSSAKLQQDLGKQSGG